MLDKEWLATFVPIGQIPTPTQWQPNGAGVFLKHHDLVWLATAKHVVPQEGPQEKLKFGVIMPINGQPQLFDLSTILANSPAADWIFEPNHDLAIAPVPLPPGIGIKALSQAQCITIEELLPSMSCLTGGCPYGLPGVDQNKTIPFVLDGVIAGVDPTSKTVFISTPTFPGNSGGPIFVVRSPYSPAGQITGGRQTVFLAGIVLGVQTIATSNPKSVPLRLGVGVSIDAVFALLDRPETLDMAERIKSES